VKTPNHQFTKAISPAGSSRASAAHGKRLIIRPSGTEPVIRVMVEGDNRELVEQLVDDICAALSAKAA
jgi:phosphoglucosamine mutase